MAVKKNKASGKSSKSDGKSSGKGGKSPEEDGKTNKASGKSSKTDGKSSGEGGKSSELSGKLSKEDGKSSEGSGKSSEASGKLSLVAPERRGRQLRDPGAGIIEARARMLLAEEHKSLLLAALRKSPSIFDQVPLAIQQLEALEIVDNAPEMRSSLERLAEELNILRSVVRRQTRPGDPERDAVLLSERLAIRSASIAMATKIVEGARSLQNRFPALTDEAIAAAQNALDTAKKAVDRARTGSAEEAAERVKIAETRQLAMDVLLDGMDQLAAAALVQLRKRAPKAAERLTAPLEKSEGPQEETEEPTPSPEPAPG